MCLAPTFKNNFQNILKNNAWVLWDTISTLRVKYMYIESNVHITFFGDNDRFQI